jgi:hypothetical protein
MSARSRAIKRVTARGRDALEVLVTGWGGGGERNHRAERVAEPESPSRIGAGNELAFRFGAGNTGRRLTPEDVEAYRDQRARRWS